MTAKQAGEEQLIVFTRYPVPGTTKTRLIPSLGADGAAALQRQMSETTLDEARRLRRTRSTEIEVLFSGGTRSQLVAWLGPDVEYRAQSDGDLGQRLTAAFAGAFGSGKRRVAAIGIDCPDLSATILREAFAHLERSDLVLGPATDGGYYLIGMGCFYSELFADIAWSTDVVRAQTLAIAGRLGLKSALLPELSDVDRPEDLVRWQQASDR
ncbi:hypothetical protein KR51_00011760 [Rubidibacter lacunae KORDI 51-2]|uniref:Glycosyltransferase n=1 Tax=Rubidibacter lacunae KORDI 51-2 TaxID=582515 RepID=U5DN19_9CHRO|nr:TIGR04282 family arsenosugar biosynthesis glycosyltransferase [Rubidibacter lacunae]ERN42247.1 hypothetical protein KR51_00011760 [Rubidibacter lacunae KORDI 51-2]